MTASTGPQTSPLPVLQTPEAPHETAAGPIFVDSTGRRLRRVRALWILALGVVAAYAVLLVLALLGGPNVAAPYLPHQPAGNAAPAPQPAAPAPGTAPSGPASPPSADVAAGAAVAVPAAAATAVPAPAAAPTTAAAPAPSAAPSAGTTTTSSGTGGKSDVAPGQSTRPTAPTRP